MSNFHLHEIPEILLDNDPLAMMWKLAWYLGNPRKTELFAKEKTRKPVDRDLKQILFIKPKMNGRAHDPELEDFSHALAAFYGVPVVSLPPEGNRKVHGLRQSLRPLEKDGTAIDKRYADVLSHDDMVYDGNSINNERNPPERERLGFGDIMHEVSHYATAGEHSKAPNYGLGQLGSSSSTQYKQSKAVKSSEAAASLFSLLLLMRFGFSDVAAYHYSELNANPLWLLTGYEKLVKMGS